MQTFSKKILSDVVYYQSYSQPYMGWKINIVDDFNKRYLITSGKGVKNSALVIQTLLASLLIFLGNQIV